ncbi:hypothetical protein L7F22_026943 [Adiantum nelumboides]|nr:hypothetical protein [Adiantum nelumboides]
MAPYLGLPELTLVQACVRSVYGAELYGNPDGTGVIRTECPYRSSDFEDYWAKLLHRNLNCFELKDYKAWSGFNLRKVILNKQETPSKQGTFFKKGIRSWKDLYGPEVGGLGRNSKKNIQFLNLQPSGLLKLVKAFDKQLQVKHNRRWNVNWSRKQWTYRFKCLWAFPSSVLHSTFLWLITHKGIWTRAKAIR